LSSKPKAVVGNSNDPGKEEEDNKKAALPKEAGVQAAPWDLTYAGADMIPKAKLDSGDISAGPVGHPGPCTRRMDPAGQTQTTSLKILPDPRSKMTDADYQKQLDFVMEVRDQLNRLTHDVKQIQSVRTQLQSRNDLLWASSKATSLTKDSSTLMDKLNTL